MSWYNVCVYAVGAFWGVFHDFRSQPNTCERFWSDMTAPAPKLQLRQYHLEKRHSSLRWISRDWPKHTEVVALVVARHLPCLIGKFTIKVLSLVVHRRYYYPLCHMTTPSSGLSLLISLLDWPRAHLLTPTRRPWTHPRQAGDVQWIENEKVRKRDGWTDRDRERKRGQMERERSVGEETLTDWQRYLLRWRSL